MQVTYNKLQEVLSEYMENDDIEQIHHAYLFAKKAHSKQIRKSGEPYIVHPTSVATILAELKLPKNLIISALMHDIIEDTEYSFEDIQERFGESVAQIVEGVTKLGEIKGYTKDQMRAENHRKILLSAAKDIRVLLVKLADRLHNMKTIEHMNREKQKVIADETLEVYAPIAHRLGMYDLKWELEDLSFKTLNRKAYTDIAKKLEVKREQREVVVEKTIERIKKLLGDRGIEFKVTGRSKHIYSIYKKMETKNLEFDELTDLFAFRIVVNTIPECYTILGFLHDIYKPIPSRFKDYIPTPKHNLYQSIHTTVITGYGIPMEFQIRTKEMDLIAENGIAAHWMYKGDKSHKELQKGAFDKLKWLNEVGAIDDITSNSKEFMNSFRRDVFTKTVIVYTPDGDVVELPANSTVLDFAFYIHSDIGYKALSGKVNDKIVSLAYKLEIGDVVTVLTSNHSVPSVDWLTKVNTTRAKEALKKYFRGIQRQNIQNEGRSLFVHYSIHNGLEDIKEFIDSESFYQVMSEFDCGIKEDFFYQLGIGEIDFEDVVKVIKEEERVVSAPLTDVIIADQKDEKIGYKICSFCYPIPGDDIVATSNDENFKKSFYIHRKSCHLAKDEVSAAYWTDNLSDKGYIARLLIDFVDKKSSLLKVLNVITEMNINLASIYSRGNINEKAICRMTLFVDDTKMLDNIIRKLYEQEIVLNVERKIEEEADKYDFS